MFYIFVYNSNISYLLFEHGGLLFMAKIEVKWTTGQGTKFSILMCFLTKILRRTWFAWGKWLKLTSISVLFCIGYGNELPGHKESNTLVSQIEPNDNFDRLLNWALFLLHPLLFTKETICYSWIKTSRWRLPYFCTTETAMVTFGVRFDSRRPLPFHERHRQKSLIKT